MTLPDTPPPPATIGSQPQSAAEVNNLVGTHLRGFVSSRNVIHQDQEFFLGTDLKAAPYFFSDTQEADIKSAIANLDTALQAIDMTFINQIVGMW
jgi:hypothetical protein